jgi:hypothetical protein
MRWRPIILDLALVVAVWALILWLLRVQRARMGQAPALRAMRAYRVYTSAAIAAAVGFRATLAAQPLAPRHRGLSRERRHLGGLRRLGRGSLVLLLAPPSATR